MAISYIYSKQINSNLLTLSNNCNYIINFFASFWEIKLLLNVLGKLYLILYFYFLLQSTPCKHPVIVLQDVAFTDLHALVEFIYHGEVNVHQRSLSSFLKTAEVLRVSGLTQQQAEETHNVCLLI